MKKHTLPELTFNYSALEPYIDEETMRIHHGKHHAAYVSKLNTALEKNPELFELTIEELLKNIERVPKNIRTAVENHGGGHFNHSLFWKILGKDSKKLSKGKLSDAINESFNSYDKFLDEFNNTAAIHFGSVWAWLSVDEKGRLVIHSTSNQDTPLSHNLIPILTIDLWEHAYYLKYQNRRPEYITSFWNVINWFQVEENYNKAVHDFQLANTAKRKVS